MKKILIFVLLIIFSAPWLLAENVTELSIGGSTAQDIDDKTGLTTSFVFWNEFNYMFALGFNPSMVWFNWDRHVYDDNGERKTETVTIGGEEKEQPVKDTANAFLFPLMIDAKVQYPVNDVIIPYAAAGMGYTVMPLMYDNENNDMYGGFSWQVHGGVAFDIPDIDDFRFVVDIKYRNASLRNDNKVELDMSGWSYSVGIQYGAVMQKGQNNSDSDIVW